MTQFLLRKNKVSAKSVQLYNLNTRIVVTMTFLLLAAGTLIHWHLSGTMHLSE